MEPKRQLGGQESRTDASTGSTINSSRPDEPLFRPASVDALDEVSELVDLAARTPDPADLSSLLLKYLAAQVGATAGIIAFYEGPHSRLSPAKGPYCLTQSVASSLYIRLEEDPHGYKAVAGNRTQFYPDIPLNHPLAASFNEHRLKALAITPLRLGATLVAICYLGGGGESFCSDVESQLDRLAPRAALLLNNSRLAELQDRSRKQTALLQRLPLLINQAMEPGLVLESIISEIVEAFDASCGQLLISGPIGKSVPTIYRSGGSRVWIKRLDHHAAAQPDLSVSPISSISNVVVADRELLDESSALRSALLELDAFALLSRPLAANNDIFGVLMIAVTDGPRYWTDQEIACFDALANLLAPLIRREPCDWEESLRRQWVATFDSLADAIFVYDRDGVVTQANSAALRLAGNEGMKLTGRTDWRKDAWRIGTAENPVAIALASGRQYRTEAAFELGTETSNYQIEVDPIIDDQGRLLGAVEVIRDITLLRRAQREAVEQRNFFESLVENAFDAIFIVDLAGRIVWFNHHTLELTGYAQDDLRGCPADKLISADAPARMGFFFNEVLKGQPQIFETRFERLDGGQVDVLVTGAPIRDGERITGSLAIARDITDQKRLNERMRQSDKLRALGELASGVAHDFNNILSVILGRAQLLQTRLIEEHAGRDLRVIIQAAIDGGQTVKRIQNFARVRADHNFAIVDLNQVALDAVNITRTRWKHEAERHGRLITVTTDLADRANVSGDASELREVLVNLIFNAVDALPAGGAISIKTEITEASVRLIVSDTVVGMSEATRGRIFDPFFTTKGMFGTGLGLSVSYGIITRHNGTIEASSEINVGTAFTLTLPVASLAEDEIAQPRLAKSSLGRILVVDDEPTVRELLVDTLESAHYSVICASSGEEAVELLSKERLDLVLTDLGMPGMNGWDVARCVKNTYRDLPVIMITGWGVELEAATLRGKGIEVVINKPFDLKTVLDAVALQLSRG